MNMRRIRPEISFARAALRAAAVLFLLLALAASAALAYDREETLQKRLPLQRQIRDTEKINHPKIGV